MSATNSLASLHSELAAQWHPSKNGSLTPDQVVAGSAKKAWWICPGGPDHEWEASLNNRTSQGSGCPCCAGQKLSATNSLAFLHPGVATQWHPNKNGNLPDGSVYVADWNNHRIQKFTSKGVFVSKWGTEGTGGGQFKWPSDVAVAPDGSVYVADIGNDRIQKFSVVP